MKHYREYQRILANSHDPDMRQLSMFFDYLINQIYAEWIEDIHQALHDEDVYTALINS